MSIGRRGGERFDTSRMVKAREDRQVRTTRKKRIFAEESARQQQERPTVYLVKGPDGSWVPRDQVVVSDVTPPWVD